MFRVNTAAAVIAPIAGELSHYLITGHKNGALVPSLLLSLSAVGVYFYYHLTRKFRTAAILGALFQVLFFTLGALFSGGLRAEQFFSSPFCRFITDFF